jgi:hypothetical protein
MPALGSPNAHGVGTPDRLGAPQEHARGHVVPRHACRRSCQRLRGRNDNPSDEREPYGVKNEQTNVQMNVEVKVGDVGHKR